MSLTASVLAKISLKVEEMWKDSRFMQEFKTYAVTAQTILSKQTATFFAPLQEKDKDRQLRVTWVNTCDLETQDVTNDCTIEGTLPSTSSQDYALNMKREITFAVDEEDFRTNEYTQEEVVARRMATALKAMDEYINTQSLVFLNTFAGVNVAEGDYEYNAVDKTTEVPAAKYAGVDLFLDMTLMADLNEISGAYLIDDGSLWKAYKNADIDRTNADGSGDGKRSDLLPIDFDFRGFKKANLTVDTFMISPGAVALASRTRNPDAPTLVPGDVQQTRYTISSPTLPGIKYDVFYKLTCTVDENDDSHIIHSWKIKFTGGMWLNPTGCPVTVNGTTSNPTGVLSFTKVVATS
jgi:hypothetical protein